MEPKDEQIGEILTLKEAAEFLQVDSGTIMRQVRDGGFPCFRVGTNWRFDRARILAWMDEQTEQERRHHALFDRDNRGRDLSRAGRRGRKSASARLESPAAIADVTGDAVPGPSADRRVETLLESLLIEIQELRKETRIYLEAVVEEIRRSHVR